MTNNHFSCGSQFADTDLGCTIDKVKCSQLLASLILESQTMNSKSMILTEFMVAWEIMIPERWRGDLSIDVMQVY